MPLEGNKMADTYIVDKRTESGKSSPNRQRLIRRIDKQIKDAIPDIVEGNSIENIGKDGKSIKVPIKGLDEPKLSNDPELGKRHRIYTGNDKFRTGDKIPKPLGQGQGDGDEDGEAGDQPGEHEFVVDLSRDEFLDYFFKDLELPEMEEKEQAKSLDHYEWRHAGHIRYGIPTRLNVIRSMTNSLGRRIAIGNILRKRVKELEQKLENSSSEEEYISLMAELQREIRKAKTIPFVDEVDLRYDHFVKEPIPIDKAVMFALMDVSGSMSREEKDIAKRFFYFLYLMLEANYKEVDIVWISHDVEAKRVTEEEFFSITSGGGTIVSSALDLADNIKWNGDDISVGGYPTKNWNIYFAQASDGDNFYTDTDKCVELIMKILKYTNYYAYIQIRSPGEENLWSKYKGAQEIYPKKFQMRHINSKTEIWKVFRGLFQKKNSNVARNTSSFGEVQ